MSIYTTSARFFVSPCEQVCYNEIYPLKPSDSVIIHLWKIQTLMEVIGVLIEKYEDENIPELTEV